MSAPSKPMMQRVCAGVPGRKCGRVLGYVACSPDQHGLISHGACPDCMAEMLRPKNLDGGADGESATQAATPTPQGSMLHECAVHANAGALAGKALRCAAVLLLTMQSVSNPQLRRPFEGLGIQAVAESTGLSRAEIYRVASIGGLGSPAHFKFLGAQVFYTAEGLCELCEFLDEVGHTVEAKALRAKLGMERQLAAAAAGVTTPDGACVRSWCAEHERRQEEAA